MFTYHHFNILNNGSFHPLLCTLQNWYFYVSLFFKSMNSGHWYYSSCWYFYLGNIDVGWWGPIIQTFMTLQPQQSNTSYRDRYFVRLFCNLLYTLYLISIYIVTSMVTCQYFSCLINLNISSWGYWNENHHKGGCMICLTFNVSGWNSSVHRPKSCRWTELDRQQWAANHRACWWAAWMHWKQTSPTSVAAADYEVY